MNNFSLRIEKAASYESALIDYFNESGFITALNGTEHTHPDFVNQLRSSEDPTSLFVRFQPDGVAHIGRVPRSFYFEVKASKTIEKNAYDQYMKLASMGSIVVIFFGIKKDGHITFRWNYIESIKFQDSHHVLKDYKNKNGIHQQDIPIVENWLSPRLLPEHEYEQWKLQHRSSGTPYAAVDFRNLIDIKFFKSVILQRLANV
jgi:hypothetical protein